MPIGLAQCVGRPVCVTTGAREEEDAMSARRMLGVVATLVLMTLVVGACGGGGAGNTSSSSNKQITIGWSVAYFDHPVYQLMMKGAREMAAKRGVKINFTDGKNDPAVQASDIDNFL